MQLLEIILGSIFILLGSSLGIMRLKNYHQRLEDKTGYFLPGAPVGSLEDKLFYIGTPFLMAAIGILIVLRGVLGGVGL